MPTYPDAELKVKDNLTAISKGQKAPVVTIGEFTLEQWEAINIARRSCGLHELESREIVFIGRHLHSSRSADGYTIHDMWLQIESALSATAEAHINPKMTAIENRTDRLDGYGSAVHDRAVFECTQRKPRAELFSVIPKGDIAPNKQKRPTEAVSL